MIDENHRRRGLVLRPYPLKSGDYYEDKCTRSSAHANEIKYDYSLDATERFADIDFYASSFKRYLSFDCLD